MPRSANPERAAAVDAIASALVRLQPGETIQYAQLHNMTMGDRNLLYRARRKVEKSHGYIFEAVHGIGIKRLDRIKVIIDATNSKVARMYDNLEDRATNTLIKDGGRMSREEKVEIQAGIAQVNAIQLAIKIARG